MSAYSAPAPQYGYGGQPYGAPGYGQQPPAPGYSGGYGYPPPPAYPAPAVAHTHAYGQPGYQVPPPPPQPMVYQDAEVTVRSSTLKPQVTPAGGPGSAYADSMERRVRHGFIRKVYGILSLQLLVTFGIVCIFSFVDSVKAGVRANPGVMWAAFGVSFGALIALACCPSVAQRSPGCYIALSVFTLAEGYLVGAIASYYEPEAVAMAAGGTVIITLALTLFAFQTRIDFTAWAGSLFVVLIAFTLFGIVVAFTRSNVLRFALAAIGLCVFGIFLVFDTQMVIGKKGSALKYDIDDAVIAALNIYMDIIQIFLYLLRLFGSRD